MIAPKTTLAKRILQDLQVAGLSEGTQQVYLGAAPHLAAYTRVSPDVIGEQQLRQYFLYLKTINRSRPDRP